MKPRFACRRCELVPRTYCETIVAAKDAISHGLAEFFWDVPLVLDAEVGKTAARIQHVGGGKRRRWADVQAAPATAAKISFRLIRRELCGCEDRPQKKP